MRKKIQRPEYLDKLIAFREKQLIKIVTGIRRCGKSTHSGTLSGIFVGGRALQKSNHQYQSGRF